MAAYDPKRPRPSAHDDEEPAPVEALLDPEPVDPEPAEADQLEADQVETAPAEPEPVESEPANEALEVDLRLPSANGSGPKVASEVPVAAAPEEGTTNRAVLAAAVGAVGLVALVVAVLLRRRRRV